MSREVDERIVAMYFDNKDFEKNARSTIETLDELKNGLDLEGAAQGLDSLQKAGRQLNFDRANTSVKNFKNTLSTLSETARKAFSFTTSPLTALENAFSTFNSYVGKVVGFDLASKLVNTIESALRQVTIDPIMSGWSEYELKMDSIKTIMSGTTETYTKMMGGVYDEAKHLDYVKEQLEELNKYADRTIYSFSDMTANIGKFTNQGVELEDATSAIKGIANAAADAGQGAQQASMAMYNISQALGVGSMKLVDWKSLENANIATTKLKDTFLQMGGALGQLKQYTDSEGHIHYFAEGTSKTDIANSKKIASNAKKIAQMSKAEVEAWLKKNNLEEITTENFRESLNKDWLDKDVLLKTLQVYSGDELDIDTVMSWGFDEETARNLIEIGEEASKAATEVRTFSKMWDALKEAAQSGWAQSMEYIFGDMQEGTKLWTRLNDIFSEMISGSADQRNNILLAWRGMERQDDGTIKAIDGAMDGRERLIDGVLQVIYLFQDFGRTIGDAMEQVFGKMTGEKLQELTESFRDFTFKIRNWFGVSDKADTRLTRIRKGLQGLLSIVKTVTNFIKIGANLVTRLAGPALDALLNVFAGFGEFFNGMGELSPDEVFKKIGDGIGTLWTKLKNLFSVGENGTTPIVDFLSNLWKDLKAVIRSWAEENGLSGTLDTVTNAWNAIKGWDGWTVISNAFEAAKKGVEDAWNAISGWDGWNIIWNFLTNVWGWLTKRQGGGKESVRTRLNDVLEEATDIQASAPSGKTGFVTWLEGLAADLEAAWNTVYNWTGWETIGTFFTDIKEYIKLKTSKLVDWFAKPDAATGETGFISWITNLAGSLEEAWKGIWEWSGWGDVANFFGDIWEFIKSVTGEAVKFFTAPTEDGSTGFVNWLKGIWKDIQSTWTEITEGGKAVWSSISLFVSNIWEWLTNRPDENGLVSAPGPKANTQKMYKGANMDNPVVAFLINTYEAIKQAWETVTGEGKAVWEGVSAFISNIWGWITGQNGTAEGATAGSGSIAETLSSAPDEKDVNLLSGILEAIGGFFTKLIEFANEVAGNTVVNDVWKTIQNLVETFAKVALGISEILHAAVVEGDWGSRAVIGVVAGVILFIAYMKSSFTKSITGNMATIAENTQSIGLQFLEVAAGIALIAGAVTALTALDEGKLWKTIGAVAVIGLVIAAVVVAMSQIKKYSNAVTQDKVTSLERFGSTLIKWIGIGATVAIVMKGLPSIIQAFGEVSGSVSGTDILASLAGVVVLVGGIGLVFAAIDKITGQKGINIKAAASTALSIVAALAIILTVFGTIFSFQGGILTLFGSSGDDAVKMINEGVKVFTAVGEGIRDILLGLIGIKAGPLSDLEEMESAENQLDWVSKLAEGFDTAQLLAIENMLNLVAKMSNTDIDSNNMQKINEALPQIGDSLSAFAWKLDDYINADDAEQKISRLLSMVQVLDAFARAVGATTEALKILQYDAFVDGTNDLFNENSMTSLVELYGGAAAKLAEAIQSGLGENGTLTFNATPIVDSIIIALGLGETAIALAVHDMVQQGINLASHGQGGEGYTVPTDLLDPVTSLLNGTSLTGTLQGFDLDKILYGEDGKSGLMGTMQGAMTELEGMDSFGDMFATKLGGSLFTDAEGNEVSTLALLQEQMGTLQESLDELPAFEIKITPVFDMQNLNADSIRAMLGARNYQVPFEIGGTSLTLNTDAVSGEIRAVQEKLNSLNTRVMVEGSMTRTSILGLADHIDGIAEAVSNMQIVLDTGGLVGSITPSIDINLGERAGVSLRTGITPKWGNIPTATYDLGAG